MPRSGVVIDTELIGHLSSICNFLTYQYWNFIFKVRFALPILHHYGISLQGSVVGYLLDLGGTARLPKTVIMNSEGECIPRSGYNSLGDFQLATFH